MYNVTRSSALRHDRRAGARRYGYGGFWWDNVSRSSASRAMIAEQELGSTVTRGSGGTMYREAQAFAP